MDLSHQHADEAPVDETVPAAEPAGNDTRTEAPPPCGRTRRVRESWRA